MKDVAQLPKKGETKCSKYPLPIFKYPNAHSSRKEKGFFFLPFKLGLRPVRDENVKVFFGLVNEQFEAAQVFLLLLGVTPIHVEGGLDDGVAVVNAAHAAAGRRCQEGEEEEEDG